MKMFEMVRRAIVRMERMVLSVESGCREIMPQVGRKVAINSGRGVPDWLRRERRQACQEG